MRHATVVFAFLTFYSSALLAFSQQASSRPQTARQAVIEMITGDEQAAFKHLTVEVQQETKKSGAKAGTLPASAVLSGLRGFQTSGLEAFDSGSVLFSVSDSKTHERLEVHVDSDDLNGQEDLLALSLHAFRDGKEIDTPLQFISEIEVGMKLQESVWRLNEVTISAKIPVGSPVLMAKLGAGMGSGVGMVGGRIGIPSAENTERPKLDTANTVRMLALAESTYASAHPETGFTCSLSDLVNQNKAMMGTMGVDLAVGSGSLNGYKFALSGCMNTPAGSFQLTAEPMAAAAGAKAFCTDATHNLRISEDGRAATCLASGKPESQSEALHVTFR